MKTHWQNPWADAIPVPIEDLATLAARLGEPCRDVDGTLFTLTEARMLTQWTQSGGPVDAYILPGPTGDHCIGVRYGNEPSEYLSPMADQAKVSEYLKKLEA